MGASRETDSLKGVRIALPETRELDLFAGLVTRRGGSALRYPLIAIRDAPDQARVAAWLDEFGAGRYQDVVFYTGEGLRRLLGAARRNGNEAAFISALGRARKIVRGPKPERALRDIGLRADLHAAEPTTAGLITTLQGLELAGRSLAIQIYGQTPPPDMVSFVAGLALRRTAWVAPYVYADQAETSAVLDLVDRINEAAIEVIAFTSSAQVERLFVVAEKQRDPALLRRGLGRILVAAVGPVVARSLSQYGVAVDLMPENRYFLKPLVREIENRLAGAGRGAGSPG